MATIEEIEGTERAVTYALEWDEYEKRENGFESAISEVCNYFGKPNPIVQDVYNNSIEGLRDKLDDILLKISYGLKHNQESIIYSLDKKAIKRLKPVIESFLNSIED